MSNEKTAPTLDRYSGPYYPSPIEQMQRRYGEQQQWLIPDFFAFVTQRVHGRKRYPFKTPDGYVWMASITFAHAKHKFRILFPTAFDIFRREDGTAADRHIALYVKGSAPRDVIDAAALKIETEFEDQFTKMFGHNCSNS